MKSGLSGRLAVDASVLIELASAMPLGVSFKDLLKSGVVEAFVSEVAVVELMYVVCRKHGLAVSKKRVDDVLQSGYFHVEDSSFLIEDAARLKCERALSLADCFCLALARRFACRALFARREGDLTREMRKKTFDVEILFLEDYK
jgi:predicted nucleic acid-binding protein